MLTYIIASSLISFCYSMPSIQLHKDVNEIVFIQHSPVTAVRVLKRLFRDRGQTPEQVHAFSMSLLSIEPQKWFILGLVPLNSTRHFLVYCKESTGQSRKYSDSVPSETFREELNTYWPTSLSVLKENTWETHYNVYGCCMTYNPLKYFQNAMKLHDTFNLEEVLGKAGIVPGGKYRYFHIVTELTNALKAIPYVTCQSFEDLPDQYLLEIHLCLDRAYKLSNCYHFGTEFCNPEIDIIYPTWQDI